MLPTPAAPPRNLASQTLRSVGLAGGKRKADGDGDAKMRDVTHDKPGGRKSNSRVRSHRVNPIEQYKNTGPSGVKALAGRKAVVAAATSDPLSIRGASRVGGALSVTRTRRNAVSESPSRIPVRGATQPGTVAKLREFVQSRWNAEARFLNLEAMAQDDFIKKNHLNVPGLVNHRRGSQEAAREAAVIYKLAAELQPEVQTLSLANNKLRADHLKSLNHYLPRIENLSLEGNELTTMRDLEHISARKSKLVHLRELLLMRNPVRETEYQHNRGEQYRLEMARRFTTLELLDQEPIMKISFDVPEASTSATPVPVAKATSFPLPMGGSFITGVDGTIINNFLMRYFPMFDSQRAGLLDVYDPASYFSYSVNATIPTRARIQGLHYKMANNKKLVWNSWFSAVEGGSRNLNRLQGGESTLRSLHAGPQHIVETLCKLPGTRHDMASTSEKFCIDAFPVKHGTSMALMLVVHGEFTEVGPEGIRSFDRTFMLAPAADGSRAKAAGWDVTILNDQLMVRAYSSPEVWTMGPLLVQAQSQKPKAAPPTLPPAQQAALDAVPDLQRPMVLELCRRSGLTVSYSVDCLVGNSWDLDRAWANFEAVKGTLPPDAFTAVL
ncbi:hypothetical protein BD626DRAFT_491278 [Schizophyllum amplum]|uniref:NTF2 domain-containing protein n=1 Tax=Schizophyllum amplum TaxID=97359 RepID=A0A550CHK3_9AGAR|nr:hypothetical protein BD626DRAFT_491278 [Auriculariopsis ampla]